jgi:nucleoside-diphosphate-sugar epimerase
MQSVLVTGGGGYVGAVLTPKLLSAGYRVKVLDLFLYGEHVLDEVRDDSNLVVYRGDIRNQELLREALRDCDHVIHLACISNDPSFELDLELGRSINYEAFRPLLEISRDSQVRRFIYASSSSVYGLKEEERVTEDLPLEPLTDYSKYKAECESILAEYEADDFTTVTVRPATVCGYSPRLRLDLTVNILTHHAVVKGEIRVFGGSQYRPNLHIQDMTDLYVKLLKAPAARIAGKVWNVGFENQTVSAIADEVRRVVGDERVRIVTEPTDDLRSYRIDSRKVEREFGFVPRRSVGDAIDELVAAFRDGKVPNSMADDRYYNIRRMQAVSLR